MTTAQAFFGLPVIQTAAMGYRPCEVIATSTHLFLPKTRPTLRFSITEALAAKHDIPLWYFDPEKWPDRELVDPAAYLGIHRNTRDGGPADG